MIINHDFFFFFSGKSLSMIVSPQHFVAILMWLSGAKKNEVLVKFLLLF